MKVILTSRGELRCWRETAGASAIPSTTPFFMYIFYRAICQSRFVHHGCKSKPLFSHSIISLFCCFLAFYFISFSYLLACLSSRSPSPNISILPHHLISGLFSALPRVTLSYHLISQPFFVLSVSHIPSCYLHTEPVSTPCLTVAIPCKPPSYSYLSTFLSSRCLMLLPITCIPVFHPVNNSLAPTTYSVTPASECRCSLHKSSLHLQNTLSSSYFLLRASHHPVFFVEEAKTSERVSVIRIKTHYVTVQI